MEEVPKVGCFGDCFGAKLDHKPKVILTLGAITGSPRTSPSGMDYVSFCGIPYGKPPTGMLRFRRPEPVEPWPDHQLLNASGKTCPKPLQLNTFLGGRVIGQEDCLRLNVYTPDLPVTENQPRYPVMVWFFGGDFVMGSSSEDLYNPEKLMEFGDMVVVTVGYRVGPLGFLCLGTESAPGNQALWDQLLALRWVQDHIRAFGGNPDLVTLAGHNAGSVCVSYHLVSPHGAGMFANAICMSGTFASPASSSCCGRDPVSVGKRFLKRFGCHVLEDQASIDQAVAKLQTLPAAEIVREGAFAREWDTFVPNPWVPVVDGAFLPDTGDPFLPEAPIKMIKKGAFNKMPTIIGHTKDEGIYFASSLIKDQSKLAEEDWPLPGNALLLNRDMASPEDGSADAVVQKIVSFYNCRSIPDEMDSKLQGVLTEMVGDALVVGPSAYASDLILAHSAQPLYNYIFEHRGVSWRFGDLVSTPLRRLVPGLLLNAAGLKMAMGEGAPGVCHGDDVFYLFSSNLPGAKALLESPEDEGVSKVLTQLWHNFAHSATPTPNPVSDPVLGKFNWEPTKPGTEGWYAALSPKPEMRQPDPELQVRCNFWKKLLSEEAWLLSS